MPTKYCQCGARYRFSESDIGRRAKCKKCGTIIILEEEDESGPIPIAENAPWGPRADAAPETVSSTPPASSAFPGAGTVPRAPSAEEARPRFGAPTTAEEQEPAHPKSYPEDVIASFFFLGSPYNLLIFLALWVVLTFAQFIPAMALIGAPVIFLFFLFIAWAVMAWYAAFCFNVLRYAAAGDTQLPVPGLTGDPMEDVVLPVIRWYGSWFIVLIPAFAFASVACTVGWLKPFDATDLMAQGPAALASGLTRAEAALLCLAYGGGFFWPIVVLGVAVGGLSSLQRFDLMVTTVVRTLPIYLLTAGIVLAIHLLNGLLERGLEEWLTPGDSDQVGVVVWGRMKLSIASAGTSMYCNIVAMRVIGLYYHHFKRRFAWNWG